MRSRPWSDMAQLDLDERQTKRDGIILTVETEKKRLWEEAIINLNLKNHNHKILQTNRSRRTTGSMSVNQKNNKKINGSTYVIRQENRNNKSKGTQGWW